WVVIDDHHSRFAVGVDRRHDFLSSNAGATAEKLVPAMTERRGFGETREATRPVVWKFLERAERDYPLLPADATLLDLVQQRLVTDAKLFGGAAAVPVDAVQGVFDDDALRLERCGLGDVGESRAGRRSRFNLIGTLIVVRIH